MQNPVPVHVLFRLRQTRWAKLLALLLMSLLLVTGAWFARIPLLQGAAQWWIVSDAVAPADAIAIFGGGLETRPFMAAEY